MAERATIELDAELVGRIVRLLRWAHDVAMGDAVLPDPEIARRIRDVLQQLESDRGEGRGESDPGQ